MSNTSFTVGRDGQAVLISPKGDRFDVSRITDFSHKTEYDTVQSKPNNGPKLTRKLPNGHVINFSMDRVDATNERLFAAIEAGWWASGSADAGTSVNGSVFFYLQETDGSTTTHQFTGVSLSFGGIGDFKGDAAVKQTIECHAQRWIMP